MDSDFIEESRFASQTSANESRALHVLSDFVKGTVDITSDIQKGLGELGFLNVDDIQTNKDDFLPSLEDAIEKISQNETTIDLCEDGPELVVPLSSTSNFLSFANSISHYNLSSHSSKEPSPGFGSGVEDDVVLGTQRRLRAYVERVLRLLKTYVDLNRDNDVQTFVQKNDELVNLLNSEMTRQEKLTNQLIKVENNAKDLEEKNQILEQKLRYYEDIGTEFSSIKQKFDQYEFERDCFSIEKEKLEKDKRSFAEGLPALEKTHLSFTNIPDESSVDDEPASNDSDASGDLYLETEKLSAEIKKLRQEKNLLLQKIFQLETSKEQSLNEKQELDDAYKQQCEDLEAQINAANKQISSLQKFTHEQAVEREHEREEYAKDIKKLEEAIKKRNKIESKTRDDVESLEIQISILRDEKINLEDKVVSLQNDLAREVRENIELRQVLLETQKENEKLYEIERDLLKKCDDLETALKEQAKLNENLHDEHINSGTILRHSVIDSISAGTEKIKGLLGHENWGESDGEAENSEESNLIGVERVPLMSPWESMDMSSAECSYTDAYLLGEKLRQLNSCIDKLVRRNSKLSIELKESTEEKTCYEMRVNDLTKRNTKLEFDLKERARTVDLLQEQLNEKHLQLSALKTRIDGTSCLDTNHLRASVNELKRKVQNEQSRSDHLSQQIDHLQVIIDEKDNCISRLSAEVSSLENERQNLNCQVTRLIQEKQMLLENQAQLELKFDQNNLENLFETQNPSFSMTNGKLHQSFECHEEDDEESGVVGDEGKELIPQLMQMLLKDKNEEIQSLNNQISDIQRKISAVVPTCVGHVGTMLDSLINSYLTLKEERRGNMKMSSHIPVKSQSFPNTPKRCIFKEKCINTDPINDLSSPEANLCTIPLAEEQEKEQDKEMEDFTLKCDQMYFRLNNLKEENDILRHELENLKQPKDSGVSGEGDSTTESNEIIVESALQKIHQNSVELLKLTESHRHVKDDIVKELLDTLTIHISNPELPSHTLLNNDEMRRNFLNNFPCRELGRLVLEKFAQIFSYYREAKEKIKFYLDQNELISTQLSKVEEALIEAQTKLDVYQKKYDKVKRRLKDLNIEERDFINKRMLCDQAELYLKYRRCLSQKSSLIYQKKYLLKVLGGFKLTERKTLALLADLSIKTPGSSSSNLMARIRFKGFVYAVIAIFRLNYLPRRYSCANEKASSLCVDNNSPKLVPRPISVSSRMQNSSHELMAKFLASTNMNKYFPQVGTDSHFVPITVPMKCDYRNNFDSQTSSSEN